MAKLNEQFLRMQKLAGILKEEIEMKMENPIQPSNELITWNWAKARSTSEDDEGVVHKVWGTSELYDYFGEFFLAYDENDDRNDIEDKDIREEFGNFIYISKWDKDTEELVDEIDNPEDYPVN
jgi:hypothetical protein